MMSSRKQTCPNRIIRMNRSSDNEQSPQLHAQNEALDLSQPIAAPTLREENEPNCLDERLGQERTNSLDHETSRESRKSTSSKQEVFCNICERNLCNKYYLRKHKSDMHGIFDDYADEEVDNVNSNHEVAQPQEQQSKPSIPLPTCVEDQSQTLVTDEVPTLSNPNNLESYLRSSLPNDIITALGQQILRSTDALRQNPEYAEATQFGMLLELLKSVMFAQYRQIFPIPNEILDFLRVVQAAGMFNSATPDLPGNVQNSSFQETMGLNITGMTSEMETSAESTEKPAVVDNRPPDVIPELSEEEREKLKASGITLSAYCTACRKQLCTKYFLRNHYSKVHRLSDEDAHRLTQTRPSLNSQTATPKTNSKQRNRSLAQTRVNCPTCDKELCNKYFLRTHLIKAHKLSSVEAADVASAIVPNRQSTSCKKEHEESLVSQALNTNAFNNSSRLSTELIVNPMNTTVPLENLRQPDMFAFSNMTQSQSITAYLNDVLPSQAQHSQSIKMEPIEDNDDDDDDDQSHHSNAKIAKLELHSDDENLNCDVDIKEEKDEIWHEFDGGNLQEQSDGNNKIKTENDVSCNDVNSHPNAEIQPVLIVERRESSSESSSQTFMQRSESFGDKENQESCNEEYDITDENDDNQEDAEGNVVE
ncbi:hypothetical protein ACOME3_001676 [Neoechinorhynchus agilis]